MTISDNLILLPCIAVGDKDGTYIEGVEVRAFHPNYKVIDFRDKYGPAETECECLDCGKTWWRYDK